MILVDASVWIDHLRRRDPHLSALLAAGRALAHPHVLGEVALGSLGDRRGTLALLADLPQAPLAGDAEVLALIEARGLHGRGVGYTDAHLLAAALLAPGTQLWTRDRRLDAVAAGLGLAHRPPT